MLGLCWVWGDAAGSRVDVGQPPQILTLKGRQMIREFRRARGDKGEVRDIWELMTGGQKLP